MVSAVGTRRTVTVLFCDLAGSTALGERLDPEALRIVLSHWYDAMRAPVERHGGTVEKFVGDAVMAVFGIPLVHEDDALRAVRAAVEMREAAARVAAELAAPLPVRIGVYSGEVVTGDARTTLVTGDAVNTAKRLEERAAEGEILIGETTRRLVENAVRLEAAEAVRAKGKRRPVAAWRVLGTIPDAPPFARRLDAPLVGRARELDVLLEELAAAERGRECRLVTVLGPAGIGKSRLASELAALVRDRTTVLGTRCLPYGDGITFWPLVQLLRDAGGDEAIATALAGERDAALVVSRLESALGDGEGAPTSADETFWALRRLLETLARERPLLVVLEDLHWGQPTFLDLVEYLAGWSRGAILLLCVARPELLDARPRWAGATVALEPLSEEESQTLLDELAAEWPVTAEARARIAAAAEGNPLFVEQLVAMLSEDGESRLELPPSIHALLEARLDRLEPLERRVLERAAVIGKEFWRGAVGELSPADERPELAAALLRLVRKELVRPWSSSFVGEDGFRFRHALIRDAAYASLPKAERAGLHERFADWLEGAGGAAEFVGYHLEQSAGYRAELGAPDKALAGRAAELLTAAGRRAFARNDMPAARSLLERALALASPDADRVELLRELATARWSTGDVAGSTVVLDEAIERAELSGDLRQEWYGRLERAARRRTTTRSLDDELAETATEAIRVFGSLGDDLGLARAWRRLALVSFTVCRYADAAAQSERALEHARRAGDASEEARIADVLCSALLFGPEPAPAAAERCRALLERARTNRLYEAAVRSSLAGLEAMQGHASAAREEAAAAAAIYDELGLRLLRAGLADVAAASELLAGDAAAAERELRLAYEIVEAAGARALLGLPAARLASLALAQGRGDEAEGLLEIARAVVDDGNLPALAAWHQASAEQAAAQDRSEEAVRLAGLAVDALAATDALSLRADAVALHSSLAGLPPDEALELYAAKGNVAAAARLRALVPGRPPR